MSKKLIHTVHVWVTVRTVEKNVPGTMFSLHGYPVISCAAQYPWDLDLVQQGKTSQSRLSD